MITRERAHALRRLIELGAASLMDEDALNGVELFRPWAPDMDYPQGLRLRHGGKLYRTRQALHSLGIYPPGAEGTEALYEEVAAPGQGETKDKPIPYTGNMELFEGKYYAQDGVVYICTRSTGQAVTHPLAALVGLYVEIA